MGSSMRFTSRDLECLPDVDGTRYEIIDGDLYVSKQPHWHHQRVCGQVFLELELWSRRSGAGQPGFAPGLIFAPDDVVPDVVWTSSARLAASLDAAGHLRAAPKLVVEVLSLGV